MQVSLQLACGAFALNSALCEAISIPMDKLKWTSPFASHRGSLAHTSHSSSRKTETQDDATTHSGSPPKETAATPALQSEEPLLSPSPLARSPRTEGEPHSPANSQADSGRGSESSEGMETPLQATPCPQQTLAEPEGMVWATAVALAWLEHSSASYFIEWELVAAKASMWLSAQTIPEGRDLAAIKAAANQLFIILRHWEENLQLNMLCYNPNSV